MLLADKPILRSQAAGSISVFGALALLCLPGATGAQESADSGAMVEEIVVTGSLIRRSEQSSQLVQTISVEDIRLQGATNALDILAAVPTNLSVDQSNFTAGLGNGLVNFANLRSLGSENTLVLVNGRRVVRSPIRDRSVNLNTIPMALVETVDVLSDGASSIYGTDAVAGVINFRMREEFQGFQYSGHSLIPGNDGGGASSLAASAGYGSLDNDGWNVYIGGTWRERYKLNSLDRDFTDQDYQPDQGLSQLRVRTWPSNVQQFDPETRAALTPNLSPYPECDPPGSLPSALVNPSPGACAADGSAMGWIDVLNPEEQWSIVAKGTAQFDASTASVEYFRAESDISSAISPTIFGGAAYQVPPNSPFFPGKGITPAIPGFDPDVPATIGNVMFLPAGRRTTQSVAVTDRVLGELSGELGGFTYELWALRSSSDNDLRPTQGAVLNQGLIDGLAGANGAPFLNPFGDQTPEGEAYMESLQYRENLRATKSKLTMVGVTLGRDLFDLPAGPLAAALAFDYGDESADFRFLPAPRLAGAVVGRDPENSGDRDRFSFTGEILVPVADALEVNASLRYDDYSDFGDTLNPKVLVSWDLNELVNLHGSFNTGFRAPTLYQLNQPQQLSDQAQLFSDPRLCPNGAPNASAGGLASRDCLAQYQTLIGGNPLLQPEESTAFTLGFDATIPPDSFPLGTVSLGADYWDYELESVIGPISPAAIFADADRFDAFLIRCEQGDPALLPETYTCGLSSAGNPIAYIAQGLQNLGTTKTSGFDFNLDLSNETNFGLVSLGYRGTYVTKYDFQRIPGDSFISRAGAYIDGFPAIEYSHWATLSWQNGRWFAQLQNRHKGGYTDCNGGCRVAAGFENEVGAHSVFNLVATFELNELMAVTLHVNNLFDNDPPFSNASGAEVCASCDTRFADPTGRAFGVTVSGAFGSGN